MTSLESNKKYKADVEKGDATTETQRDQKISTTERDECYCMLASKEVTKETTFSNQETKAEMSISLPVEESEEPLQPIPDTMQETMRSTLDISYFLKN